MAKSGGTKTDSGFRITISSAVWKQRGSARQRKRNLSKNGGVEGTSLVQNYKGYNRRYNIKSKFRFANSSTKNARADVVEQLSKKKIRSYQ